MPGYLPFRLAVKSAHGLGWPTLPRVKPDSPRSYPGRQSAISQAVTRTAYQRLYDMILSFHINGNED